MSNRVLNLIAGETLTDKEGAPIMVTSGKAYMCDAVTDACIGVLTKGGASAAEVEVTIFGEAPVRIADTVKRGEHLVIASGGETCDGGLASGSVRVGLALQDGVSGDLIPAFITPPLRYEEG
jgi:hypothetical protein